MYWENLTVGIAACCAVMAFLGGVFVKLGKTIRTFVGVIHSVRDLTTVVQDHLKSHGKPMDEQKLNDLGTRLDRLEAEFKDMMSMLPHIRPIPKQG